MSLSLLDRELYDINLAASVLRMAPSTLRWWLEGGERNGKLYPPVIREEPTNSRTVTWGELVEARYLLGYRRGLGVRLGELRAWIAETRQQLGVPYPLAHQRPWVGEGRRILIDAQNSSGVPEELWAMWQASNGQILLTAPAESFLERVEFAHDEAIRIHPAGPESPIVIDPQVRFGMPAVKGIPIDAIVEQIEAGDPIEMVASDFNLDLAEVAAVFSYEHPVAA
jgi:uncharacterized protein (DUF433 family)